MITIIENNPWFMKIDQSMVRQKTARGEELTLPPMDNFCSHYVSKLLAFTVKRKLNRLDLATCVICSPDHDSAQKLRSLKQLASLVAADTRLGDFLDSRVLPQLIKFLEYKEQINPVQVDYRVKTKPHPEDLKNRRFQYYAAFVLTNIVSSNKGVEFKNTAIPALVKLILTWHWFVQIQVLYALFNIANVFPDTCEDIVKNGALEHLESLLANDKNHYALKSSGIQFLSALCRMNPLLCFDESVIRIIKTAIFSESVSLLLPACLSVSNFTNKRFVDFGSEVYKRLLDLTKYVPEIALYALRAIANYVRWCENDQLQSIIDHGLLIRLSVLCYHKHMEVRKETCWIISNITVAANNSQIQRVIGFRLILELVRFVEDDEVEVKEVAARAISNAVLGSDKEQFKYLREDCFESLNIKRYFSEDPRMIAACLQVYDSILYHASTLESAELPRKMKRLSIGAHMTSCTTDNLASNSAKYAQSSKKVTRKKKIKKGKELSTPDSLVNSTENLDSEDITSEKKSKKRLEPTPSHQRRSRN